MDVGAGSGLLSFFALQGGAAFVAAVEPSDMAPVIRNIARQNFDWSDRMRVLNCTVEDLHRDTQLKASMWLTKDKCMRKLGINDEAVMEKEEEKEKFDVIISEPIGTFLFNERMWESVLFARDKFLKPGGKLYPGRSKLFVAPFQDHALRYEISQKSTFWDNEDFMGIDISAGQIKAEQDALRMPVVDYIDPEFLLAPGKSVEFDFEKCTLEEVENFDIEFEFDIEKTGMIDGIAGWFDCFFDGPAKNVTLSTAPGLPGTHWYQIRFVTNVLEINMVLENLVRLSKF